MFASVNVEIACPPAVWKEKHLKVQVKQERRTLMLFGDRLHDCRIYA